MQSAEYFSDWNQNHIKGKGSEWFCLGLNEWSIDYAKHVLKNKPRKSWPLNVKDWKGVAEIMNKQKPLGKHINTGVPVICIPFGTGWLPIDGWSRIRLAIKQGVDVIPCVRLTKVEAISLERQNVQVEVVPNSTKPPQKTKLRKSEPCHVHVQESPEANRRNGTSRSRTGSAAVRCS